MKIAGKQGLKAGAFGALGGALGGGLAAGPVGAALGATTMGTGLGLGSGLGIYANLKSMQKMTPDEIKKFAKEGEKLYGKNHAEVMRQSAKTL